MEIWKKEIKEDVLHGATDRYVYADPQYGVNSRSRNARPLHGYHILTSLPGHGTSRRRILLADQARDIHHQGENPQGGDRTRAAANRAVALSASFLNNNRNERSVVLDLKAPAGVAALKRLITGADVLLIQNFRTGVIDRMGFGEEAVRARAGHHLRLDQRLRRGGAVRPEAGLRSADPGAVGACQTSRAAPTRTAHSRAYHLPDKLTGVVAAQAITAALLARRTDRQGQQVRLSMLDAVVAFLWGSDMGGQLSWATNCRNRRRPASST